MRRRLAAVTLAGMALTLGVSGPARAADPIEVDADIGGRDIATAGNSDPIRIDPDEQIPLRLTLHNASGRPEVVRYVRLEGKALGLTFLTYDLGVRTTLAPGESATVDTFLDFFDLEKQATGYLGTSLRVYDPERRLLAEQAFVVDVRGNLTSTLGLFSLLVVGIAGFSVAVLVINTVRRRLPVNRFVRGLQFAVAGGAIGVTLALGFSVLRVAFTDVDGWGPLVFIPTVVAFALGYLAPGPLSQSIRQVLEERALQAAAEEAVAKATGAQAAGQRSGGHDVVDLDAAQEPAAKSSQHTG